MKTTLCAVLAAGVLSACSVGTPGVSLGLGLGTSLGSHVGLGTSINIPLKIDQGVQHSGKGGINIIEEQIVSYFDAQGQAADQAVKGGFYRRLIAKRGSEYVVQDFYGDNGRKRTDPYVLQRSQLLDFRAVPTDGSLTVYAYNGAVMQQQVFQGGRLLGAKY